MSETGSSINPSVPPSGRGCAEGEATRSWWVHHRRCAQCGHIGCCDDSLNRHATAHWHASGHPVIQTFEPDEEWFWNYETDDYTDGPELAPPHSHPRTQSVPGPADRLPADWREILADRRG